MNPLITPLLHRYTNADFIQFMKNAISTVNVNNAAALHLDTQVAALQTELSPLDNLFVKERGSNSTDDLVALDARRDDALTGIRTTADGYTFHFDAAMREPAKTLFAAIDKYGVKISRKNYTAETGIIDSLVTDLQQQPALTAAVNTLGLYAWVNELKAANTAFNDMYLSRTSEYAGRPQGNIPDMRAAITEKYRLLVQHLTAYATLSPEEHGYASIISQLSSLAAQYNDNTARRTGRSKTVPGTPATVPVS